MGNVGSTARKVSMNQATPSKFKPALIGEIDKDEYEAKKRELMNTPTHIEGTWANGDQNAM